MKIQAFIASTLLFFLTLASPESCAWGQKGHDVTCAIAQKHLTKKAQKHISEILDGKSIVYWANWMDNASNTPQYAYTKTWHYKNIDSGQDYYTAPEDENGDVVKAIEAQIAALKSSSLNKEAEALSLKMLVHLVGDLHCPMHISHKSDRGGNQWQVRYFNSGKNLHSIWDSDIVESAHKWTHDEWVEEIDRVDRKTVVEMVEGSPNEWAKETYEIAEAVYAASPKGANLSYDYVAQWSPVVEQQLLRAGLRLASILNDIFR